jgi:hypothetical protein
MRQKQDAANWWQSAWLSFKSHMPMKLILFLLMSLYLCGVTVCDVKVQMGVFKSIREL